MKAVKEVLKQNKLPAGFPPTAADVKTREKHVPQSVDYNIKHFSDHGSNVTDNLSKLHQVNPESAHHHAAKSAAEVKRILGEVEQYMKGNCKECK